jgi:hypothetical protein
MGRQPETSPQLAEKLQVKTLRFLLCSFPERLFLFGPGEKERTKGALRRLHLHHGATAEALDGAGVVFEDLVIQIDFAPAGYAFDFHLAFLPKRVLKTPSALQE